MLKLKASYIWKKWVLYSPSPLVLWFFFHGSIYFSYFFSCCLSTLKSTRTLLRFRVSTILHTTLFHNLQLALISVYSATSATYILVLSTLYLTLAPVLVNITTYREAIQRAHLKFNCQTPKLSSSMSATPISEADPACQFYGDSPTLINLSLTQKPQPKDFQEQFPSPYSEPWPSGCDSIHVSPRQLPSSPTRTVPRKTSRHQFGDRYIPNRNGINLQAAFSLVKDSVSQSANPKVGRATEISRQKIEEADQTFSTLLRSEIFGNEVPSALLSAALISPTSNSGDHPIYGTSFDSQCDPITPPRPRRAVPKTPNRNLFRYQSPHNSKSYSAGSETNSPFPNITPPGTRSRQKSPAIGNTLQQHDQNDIESFPMRTEHPRTPTRIKEMASPPSRIAPESIDPTNEIYSLSPVRFESQRLLLSPKKQTRGIPKIPYKVLDAPDLLDDYYLNLVDWGSQNILGVGLGSCVYLWHAQSSNVNKLCDLGSDDVVTSLSWIKRGTHIAVGTKKGLVQIWDAEKAKRVRNMTGHELRAGSLAWNEHTLSSGSRDRTILHRDVRVPEHYVKRLIGHKQEVCGLKWNTRENQLASGGNDNKLIIWDRMSETPLFRFTDHSAAVKALAWSPHARGLLASGGGSADRRIRFWNTLTGTCLNEIDTGSQVCNLAWSKTSNEIVSTHGYSKNQVVIWKYPSMKQVAALTGHTYRVLYLAMSPDGRTIVTGAGDETLRFWNVFGMNKSTDRMSTLLDVFPQLR